MRKNIVVLAALTILVFGLAPTAHATLVNPGEIGINDQSRSNNYDMLVDDFFSNDKIVTTIDDKLWVPWFKSSSQSEQEYLQAGHSCSSGRQIDFQHNCMVSDEFSQVGILVAMGNNQERMDRFYNTVAHIQSTNGKLPSWRVYRDGNTIQPCRQGINSNCDSASDASARIIIALFTASKNAQFTDQAQKERYAQLGRELANDMLEYEVEQTCRDTERGVICHWFAGGAEVKRAGIGATNFAYTGYFSDAVIAMLAAYADTGEERYAHAAKGITANYLQAARFNGHTFSAPPGMAFRWVIDANGIPQAECTNNCGPAMWDSHDAPRALGMCGARYYAELVEVNLPQLDAYCNALNTHMSNPDRAPMQFTPDGTAHNVQSGYFAQGLQALHQSGANPELFARTLDNALRRYSPQTKTFSYEPAFGAYTQNFAVRALGIGIGRDRAAYGAVAHVIPDAMPPTNNPIQERLTPAPIVDNPADSVVTSLRASCDTPAGPCQFRSDATSGVCRAVVWSTTAGNVQLLACEKEGGYVEVYRHSSPPGTNFRACLGGGCVDTFKGFDRFHGDSKPSLPVPETAPIPETPRAVIASLLSACSFNGAQCMIIRDVTEGVCRQLTWSTNQGTLEVLGCEKDSGNVELYLQRVPAGAEFRACLGGGCVDKHSGFARFSSNAQSAPQPVTVPTPDVTPPPQPDAVSAIARLALQCSVGTSQCMLRHDVTEGVCRTLVWSTGVGNVQLLGCEKDGGHVEVYRQSMPQSAEFTACIGTGCVDRHTGFARFRQ